MNIVEGKNLEFEYVRMDEKGQVESTVKAVDGVDLAVKAGDFIAILGHKRFRKVHAGKTY